MTDKPVKIDGQYFADFARHQHFLDLAAEGSVTVIKSDAHILAGPVDGVDDALRLGRRGRHGFFGHDIAARIEGGDDILIMKSVRCRDNNGVRLFRSQHLVEIACGVCLVWRHACILCALAYIGETARIDIGDRKQLCGRLVRASDGVLIQVGAAAAADNDD